MGHYRSEMGGDLPPSEAEIAAAAKVLGLRERGYSDPLTEGGFTGHVIRPGEARFDRDVALRWHKPCGQAVFDPEMHDRYCPATPKLTSEQEALRKDSQFWSDAAASYYDR